jgi:hypothetical protein
MNRGIALNSTKFSVMDASKAFKKSRTTIYEALKMENYQEIMMVL